jgi:hypothetical protein
MVRCFKCEKEIKAAVVSDDDKDTWEMPDGVHFSGGWNFGSSLYDAMMDGLHVEIVVCDDCIKAAQGTDRMREVQGKGHVYNK